MEELMQHEAGEGQEMQARQGRKQVLVVARQAAEARHPGEAALNHPTLSGAEAARSRAWVLGLGQFDGLQLEVVGGLRGRGAFLPPRRPSAPFLKGSRQSDDEARGAPAAGVPRSTAWPAR